MYPNEIIFGLALYDILICVGIIMCFFVFGRLADRRGLKVKLQNFCLILGIFAITLGFGSAVLFQAIYNIAELGRFELSTGTGATFYGGLVGGVAVFLIGYFGVGRVYFKNIGLEGYHSRNFFNMASCAIPSIIIAHAFGRVGCLTAGCCHGAKTDAWYGIMMYGDAGYASYVPIQLFEAVYLFCLFGLLYMNSRDGKRYNLSLYMTIYGVWRFAVEFARADYRGSVGLPITPSQLIALIMIVGAIGVFWLEKTYTDRQRNDTDAEDSEDSDAEDVTEEAENNEE